MATITYKGARQELAGDFVRKGQFAPPFVLTGGELENITLANFIGKRLILNIFPSVDSPVGAQSMRMFENKSALMPGTEILGISADLPFAVSRFCREEGLKCVLSASTFRSPTFALDYGVLLESGRFKGLTARAVVCIDELGTIAHAQLVPELTQEPDYEAAIAAL